MSNDTEPDDKPDEEKITSIEIIQSLVEGFVYGTPFCKIICSFFLYCLLVAPISFIGGMMGNQSPNIHQSQSPGK